MEPRNSFAPAELSHRFGSKYDFERYVSAVPAPVHADVVQGESAVVPAAVLEHEQGHPEERPERAEGLPAAEGGQVRHGAPLRRALRPEPVSQVRSRRQVHAILRRRAAQEQVPGQELLLQRVQHALRGQAPGHDRPREQAALRRCRMRDRGGHRRRLR